MSEPVQQQEQQPAARARTPTSTEPTISSVSYSNFGKSVSSQDSSEEKIDSWDKVHDLETFVKFIKDY